MRDIKYDEQVEFRATPVRCVYSSDNFKVYGCAIDEKKYPHIAMNRFKNVSISGDLPELSLNTEYEISATAEKGKYGISYRVAYIQRDLPKTKDGVLAFLQETLTPRQATVLYDAYPDIITKVKDNKLDDIDLDKLEGIGEYRFEGIKTKIIENFGLASIIMEFKGVFTKSMAVKIKNRYTSIATFKKAFKEDPYKTLTELNGVGFKKADALILQMQDENAFDFGYDIRTSKYRCLACVRYILEENETACNTKMSMADARSKCIKLAGECVDNFGDIVLDDDIHYDSGEMTIGFEKTYSSERHIADEACRRSKFNPMPWRYDVENYRNINGVDLSDEQMSFFEMVCAKNFTLLTAPAGAGKSFATKALINMLEDNDKSYLCMSPTGKAAKRLSEYTGRPAYTIHKVLNMQCEEYEDSEAKEKSGRSPYSLDVDVVIIDEVGMVDVNLFSWLLSNVEFDVKIVLIGDMYQLNSIGAGALLRDLYQSGIVPKVEFTKIYRMGEGGVLTACTYIRQRQKFINKNETTSIGADKSYAFIPANKENMNDKVASLYKKLLGKMQARDITVISSYNKGENGCDKLNKLLQPIANPNAIINSNNRYMSVGKDDKEVRYYVGDSVIQIKNSYSSFSGDLLAANGERGEIIYADSDMVTVSFDNVDITYGSGEVVNNIKHAFALSCHRMQGSQNKVIIFCCPSSHVFFLSNNIIYTGVSRAEKAVFHLSDARTLNIAMNKSDVDSRKTYLGDMLK